MTWEKFTTQICSINFNLLLIYLTCRNELVWRPKSYWNQCKNSGSTTNNHVLFLALCPSSSFLCCDLLKRTKHSLRQISICSCPVLQVILLFSLAWKPSWCSPTYSSQLAQQWWLTLNLLWPLTTHCSTSVLSMRNSGVVQLLAAFIPGGRTILWKRTLASRI